jgi:hypothetical protein
VGAVASQVSPEQDAAYASLHTVYARLTSLDAANQELASDLADTRAELDAARREAARHRAAAESTRAELLQMTMEFERANEELRREYAAAVGEQAAMYTALPLDGLLSAFSAMARAESPAEVLESLVGALAQEFPRVALFGVRGTRLQGGRQIGFDLPDDISKIAVPLAAGTLLARAVSSRQLESHVSAGDAEGDDAAPLLPFGGDPGCAVAIPLVCRREMVGVIYADDADAPGFTPASPHTRLKFAELLRQYACLLLLKLASLHDGSS